MSEGIKTLADIVSEVWKPETVLFELLAGPGIDSVKTMPSRCIRVPLYMFTCKKETTEQKDVKE